MTTSSYGAEPRALDSLGGISVGAVLAGVAITLIVQILLGVLGLGLGLATVDPATNGSPTAATFSISAGIWTVIAGVIAAAAGGFVAARVSRSSQLMVGALTGLTAWAVATLLALYLLTSAAAGILGGAFSAVSSAAGGVGRTVASSGALAAPALNQISDPFTAIERQVRETSGGDDPAALRDRAVSAVRLALTGDPAQQEQAKTIAAESLAKAQNVPVEQARGQIDTYINEYKQTAETAKQQAVKAADAAARYTSTGALFAFLALVLGAAAAFFAGRQGTSAARNW